MATSSKPRSAAAAARAALALPPSAPAPESAAAAPSPAAPVVELSAADRENPDKLSGEALRRLAHQRGVARSEAETMSDEKLRLQLRYIIGRQYAEVD